MRVVELGQLVAAPYCGQLLGDLGAEVVKIEDPNGGDPMRQWGRQKPDGHSLWWSVVGRNKKSVCVDLRRPEGQDLVRRLVAQADVVVENFRPGTLERWGLGYDRLSADNPGLVLARITGFGQTGPYSGRAGYGSIGEAMGGLRYVVGDPSAPPSRVGIAIGDTLAAVFAAMGVMSALIERDRTGRGQIVDAAIYESVFAVMESLIADYEIGGQVRERSGSFLPDVAPSNVYPCADGTQVLLAANQDTVFRRLAKAMGEPGLATDPRYATHNARGARQAELDRRIAAWTATMPWERLDEICQEHGVPAGIMFRAPEMLADPHFRAREAIVRVAHPYFGDVPMQNVFPRLSRTPGEVKWAGPELGRHTDEVLTRLGVDAADVARLRREGVLR
ncbi:CaiB/BaiF CoA transferase family protein [Tsukamurella soli]